MRRAVLLAGVLVWLTGCGLSDTFACESDEQCVHAGTAGVCQSTGYCSFPDAACSSGQRYGAHAGDGLERSCVPEGPAASDGTAAATTGDVETDDPMTSSDVTGTTGPTSSSTSGPGSDTGDAETTTGELLDPDLVAWYRFEDPLEDGAEDSTDNMLHGTCVMCPTQAPGVHGTAAAFDGEGQFIELPASPLFDLTDAFTVATWARVEAWSPGVQLIIGRAVGDDDYNSWEVLAWVSTDGETRTLVARMAELIDSIVSISLAVRRPSTDWHHGALTWDGTEARLYVDGALVDETPIAEIVYDDHVVRIGADSDFGEVTHFLRGAVDDVRIYQRALSSGEIAELADPS